ncbi:MAG: hypothetical protein IJM33_03140 [Bacteroidales bacterium]|nr:hypothetical protein [Bacteroidales bacterium]MBR3412568.1 hypothetical protein [Bacteroidales bacterium]
MISTYGCERTIRTPGIVMAYRPKGKYPMPLFRLPAGSYTRQHIQEQQAHK